MAQPSITGSIVGISQQTTRRVPPPYDHRSPFRYPGNSVGPSSVPIASEVKELVITGTIANFLFLLYDSLMSMFTQKSALLCICCMCCMRVSSGAERLSS